MLAMLAGSERNVNRALREIKAFEWEGDYRPAARNALKELLEGGMERERTEYLCCDPYERLGGATRDYRNGYGEKWLESEMGEVRLRIPRTRSGDFYPSVVEKYARRPRHVTRLIVACFLLGLSTRKASKVLGHCLGIQVSAQTVSEMSKVLDKHAKAFHRRELEDRYRFLFFDGVYLKHKGATQSVKRVLLCAYGITRNGAHELIDFMQAGSESAANWESFTNDLYRRGLVGADVEMIITDGGKGLHSALGQVYPRIPLQRCWAHKSRNVLDKVKKCHHDEVKAAMARIWDAANRHDAVKAYWKFVNTYKKTYPRAVACLQEDIEDLLQFYTLKPTPEEIKGKDIEAQKELRRQLWKTTRTTNLIERSFVEVRRRTRPMGVLQNKESVERIVYAVFSYLNDEWAGTPLSAFTQIC